MREEANIIGTKVYDNSWVTFSERDHNYRITEYDRNTGKVLSENYAPSLDDMAIRGLTHIPEEQGGTPLSSIVLKGAATLVGIGGLVGLGVLANKGYAPSGVALFGITTLCSIGLANMSQELSDITINFNNELIQYGFTPLYFCRQ
jgi:hypothetical protein